MKRIVLLQAIALASLFAAGACNRPATAAGDSGAYRSDSSGSYRSSSPDSMESDSMSRGDRSSSFPDSDVEERSALSDSAITAKVRAALIAEPALKSTGISVETTNGVVQLSGFVPSEDDVDRAVSAASSVDDVTAIRNELRVR